MSLNELLRSLDLVQYQTLFEKNDLVDLADCRTLTDTDLQELGITSPEHREKLLSAFADTATEVGANTPAAKVETKDSNTATAEMSDKQLLHWIKIPGWGLQLAGIICVTYGVVDFYFDVERLNQGVSAYAGKMSAEAIGTRLGAMLAMPILIVGNSAIVLAGAFTVKAGRDLLRLRNRRLIMAAALGTFLCIGIGVPSLVIGIWTLISLGRPEVRAAFDQQKSRSS